MKDRCYNINSHAWENYVGRGIKICEEWKNNIISFYNWSMQNGYTDNLTIDRINVDGNYEPSNCRWVTMKIQANNRRYHKLITYNNETHNLTEWADILKINRKTLNKRLLIGWSIKKAFTTPVNYSHNLHNQVPHGIQ